MIEVLQRFTWNGTPKEISDLFRVTKNRRKHVARVKQSVASDQRE